MDEIEENRQLLDFINDDRGFVDFCLGELPQPFRSGGKTSKHFGRKEIDREQVRKRLFQPCRFLSAPRAEEKEAVTRVIE